MNDWTKMVQNTKRITRQEEIEVISKKLGNIPYTGSQLSIQNVALVEEEDEIHIRKEL